MKIDILGVKIDRIRMKEALREIEALLKRDGKFYIVTPNPEIVMKAIKDENYKEILNKAALSLPDGIGIIWAGKFLSKKFNYKWKFINLLANIIYGIYLLGYIILRRNLIHDVFPERVTGVDLTLALAKFASENQYTISLLGAGRGIAKKAGERLLSLYPNLKLKEALSGPFIDKEGNPAFPINLSPTDILFVAFGSPKQEKFIFKHLKDLNCKIAIGVGGTFDFIAGKTKRAPKFVQKIGLEWLWRLFCQPTRICRIWTAFPKFVWKVINYKLNHIN